MPDADFPAQVERQISITITQFSQQHTQQYQQQQSYPQQYQQQPNQYQIIQSSIAPQPQRTPNATEHRSDDSLASARDGSPIMQNSVSTGMCFLSLHIR